MNSISSSNGITNLLLVLASTLNENDRAKFSQFLSENPEKSWLIVSDDCIDKRYPTNSFAFTIFPKRKTTEFYEDVKNLLKTDLKKRGSLTHAQISFLRNLKSFTVVFTTNKIKLIKTPELAEEWIKNFLHVVENWPNKKFYGSLISSLKEINSGNLKLLNEIILYASFAAFLATHIHTEIQLEEIVWIPDRGKQSDAWENHGKFLFHALLGIFTNYLQLPTINKIGMSITWREEFDLLIRIPDYFAGSIAQQNFSLENLNYSKPKHKQLFEQVYANNPHLLVISMKATLESIEFNKIHIHSKQLRYA